MQNYNQSENPLAEDNIQNPQLVSLQYIPQSDCASADTVVPEGMRYEMLKAMETLNTRVGGVDKYVAEKLGYMPVSCSKEEFLSGIMCLCNAFSAEQIDAIALAIWNIENRDQAIIVGDQTGVGKGRIAAGMIKYALHQGKTPIFITEKPNLFSDLYRDLIDIGADDGVILEKKIDDYQVLKSSLSKAKYESIFGKDDSEDENEDENEDDSKDEYVTIETYEANNNYVADSQGKKMIKPFIVNGKQPKTNIKDKEGNIIYQGIPANQTKSFLEKNKMPEGFDVILATYSQFSSEKYIDKRGFLLTMSVGAVLVMDESHNASGDSKVGKFLKEVISKANVCFLSATFAKRPENLPVYAVKTSMSEINATENELVDAIKAGGPALQEIISSQLVSEGQMVRRERSFDGIQVDYVTLNSSQTANGHPELNLSAAHKAVADRITDLIRDIISFQLDYIEPALSEMDEEHKASYKDVEGRKGVKEMGITNSPAFSGIFQLISQMLFSIKADAVAELAIEEMKHGRKPVIAFANTMESFLDTVTNDDGSPVKNGDIINADFRFVLERRLKTVLKYTVTSYEDTVNEKTGQPEMKEVKEYKFMNPYEVSKECGDKYNELLDKITKASTGITFSPIDVLIEKIKRAGFTVAEVTGRKRRVEFLNEYDLAARVAERKAVLVNDAFREFNENITDCLLINQSGSTGASAHAIKLGNVTEVTPEPPTNLMPKNQVKQRTMIILQPELDINKEMQKRGRINRTGQFFKPRYMYVSSDIAAEKRLMMMLKKKLKSLDANTSSNQNQGANIFDSEDFLNKYGDRIVTEWLKSNPLINTVLGDPLKFKDAENDENENSKQADAIVEGAALKVSGRVAILDTNEQERFYSEVTESYNSTIEYLIETGEYDLEVEALNLEAETETKMVADPGRGGNSIFSRQSVLEKCRVNNLRKPMRKAEVEAMLQHELKDENGNVLTAERIKEKLIGAFNQNVKQRREADIEETEKYYETQRNNITSERKYVKMIREGNGSEAAQFIAERKAQLDGAEALAVKRIETKYDSLRRGLGDYFEYFHTGKVLAYPLQYDPSQYYKAIFIGFSVNMSARNPFAPSAVKLKIAIAGPDRYINIPASNYAAISSIISATAMRIHSYERNNTLEMWDELIRESSGAKTTRYIVTGNILQAFSKEQFRNGKLIKYTTSDGGIKKGILLPFGFNPEGGGIRGAAAVTVTVPIMVALPIVKGLYDGRELPTNTSMSIMRRGINYILFIPKASTKDKEGFYKDETIKGLTTTGYFEEAGAGKFRATVLEDKIESLCEYLDYKYKMSVIVNRMEFETLDIQVDEYSETEYKSQVDEFVEKLQESVEEKADEAAQEQAADDVDAFEAATIEDIDAAENEIEEKTRQIEILRVAGMLKDVIIELM